MRAKETLQLRHQLSASGLSLRAAAYDTSRHHVLTFDSHPLRPHVLRLFSLRRELKSAPLFDKNDEEDTTKAEKESNIGATRGFKRPSFFELQQQQQKQQSKVEVVVPSMLLQYSPALDVFVCAYTHATRPRGSSKVPKTTLHSVALLEPATLRKLLEYHGPESHLLQCAHYDPVTDRLVLASHLKSNLRDVAGGDMLPSLPQNVVEILQLSKRPDDGQPMWSAVPAQEQHKPKMLLIIENTRASLRHPDTLTIICGSRGLKQLYGAAEECYNSGATFGAMLEWREKGERFVLTRRVMLREKISAMAVSPCGDWLFAGFCKGGLKVWNANGSRTSGSALFTIDAEPYEPTGSTSVVEGQSKVLSSIEITTMSTPNSTDNSKTTDAIVIAVEKTGAVRHWKFSVEREMFGNVSDKTIPGEHRYPRLDLVGFFNAGSKEQLGKDGSSSMLKNQDTLGPPLKTLVMCVTIDMGSCFENLLLVVHEDVIHVLKVQTVLYVMQEFASMEETYVVRAIVQQNESMVLSLSSTAASKLRIFPLDKTSNRMSCSSKQLFISPPTTETAAHVSAMETLTNDRMQLYFVVLAWSSGVVDVHDVVHERLVMKFQDNQLTDQISALSVATFPRATTSKAPIVPDEAGEAGFLSYWDFPQTNSSNTSSGPTIETSDEDVNLTRTLIVVGTESGNLYGWNATALWSDNLTFQSIQKANVRVRAAHSSHVVQIARIDGTIRGERALLASVGAGSLIKLWKVPSLKMISYVNSAVEGYPVPPSCIELLKGVETEKRKIGELYVTVGYEDGRVAVWGVDAKCVAFQKLDVSTKHERRVSNVCRVSNAIVSTGLIEFLSCSLDMTVIQWEISESGSAQEKRYFDIGSAIVDIVLVNEQAVVALAHEVCKFEFAPSSTTKPAVGVNTEAKQLRGVEAVVPPTDDEYPDTPTTRSIEDPAEAATPSRRTSRSFDEYLTLHVPSPVLHLEGDSSCVVAADSAPVTKERDEHLFNSRSEKDDAMYIRGSKSTDKLQRPFVDDDILRKYLQDYITRHGTGGTMAANRITHLLSLRPELPSVKRPGFALAKSLKDLKLTAQARLDSEEALLVLRILFAMPNTTSMTGVLNRKEHSGERARAQRLREKTQARRKPVVTYNLLGEKHVRWEEDPAEPEHVGQNQSPTSPTNSLVVHTPPSPKMRNATGFKKDSQPSSIAVADSLVSEAVSALDITQVEPNQQNFEEGSTEDEEDGEEEDGDGDDEDDDDSDNGDANDSGNDTGEDKTTLSEKQEHVQPTTNESTGVTTSAKKLPRSRHARRHNGPNMSENALISSMRLSPMFQQFWTKGYCWCESAPRLHVLWTGNNDLNADLQEHKAGTERHRPKCTDCHKRLHTIEVPRVGCAPHFSRQNTFNIITEVYSKLTSSAHTRLYKKASPTRERSSECSIVCALFEVFLATYGIRSVVEKKLKLFFVAMCHFVPEYDAVAVFGELLGLHTQDVEAEFDQAPNTLVALSVCCFSWFYSRGMVVNGDSFSGHLRGREWESIQRPANTEVIPATDGTTHWQFVRIEHALLCAQDNLLYPLVSPGFLRNIMLFVQEYTQQAPTRSMRTDSPDFANDDIGQAGDGPRLWIELHRFLRLLVGEWRHQNAQFRVVERLMFVYPQREMVAEGALLEKLRLLLSCFIFYDHERAGVMTTSDFQTLLSKLRHLWPEENVVDEETMASRDAIFENAMLATKKRFLDSNHDGQLCYLDFWAMLYIVGVKTHGLIQFHEIPKFCRNYKLEVSSELSDMVWNYMQLSCSLLLPKGLEVGKSSMDQKAERQHRRRVGGLHDGTFHFSKTLKGSLSAQELLGSDASKKLTLFLDGSVPVARQTASTTALDRFRPVSVDGELGSSRRLGREPVVVGVRPTGPTPKPVAPIRVSTMGDGGWMPQDSSMKTVGNKAGIQHQSTRHHDESKARYTNMYIQFPRVAPVRRRFGSNEVAPKQIVGSIPMEKDSSNEEDPAMYEDATIEQEERMDVEMKTRPDSSSRTLSSRSEVPVPEVVPPVQEDLVIVDQRERKPSLEKRRSATPVVVVPTVETEVPSTRPSSRSELQKRQSLVRAISEGITIEEAVAQLETEEESPPPRTPTPEVPVVTVSEEISLESEIGCCEDLNSSENTPEIETNDVEPLIEVEEESVQEEVIEPAPVLVEEAPPEPEPASVQVVEEIAEPAVEPPKIEELPQEVEIENDVEPPVVVVQPPEPIDVADVMEEIEISVNEEVSPITILSPVDEPIVAEVPVSEMDETSDVASDENVPETPDDSQYTPQVVKQDDIQIHHSFRFSQQPTFLQCVTVANNPYRTAMWNPNDDTDSDGDDDDEPNMKTSASTPGNREGFPVEESEDELKHPNDGAQSLQSTVSVSAKSPFDPLPRLDNRLQHHHRTKLAETHLSHDPKPIQDDGEDDPSTIIDVPLLPMRRKRLDEAAERALYGERIVNMLGEGIAFSPEAEASMKQKWQQFFDDSESKMFSTMRQDLKKKQIEQQEAEERQRKLRKKWQEQRDQDLQRLQHSRHSTTTLMSIKQQDSANGVVDATFRMRRIHRESCQQLTEELQFGVSVQRELQEVNGTQFFHFYYFPDGHGSIVTLKMHVLRGDAEVFMSTDTKVPCATDFMWRSFERLGRDSGEGHRIVLYPHDLQRAMASATANTVPTEQTAVIEKTTSRSMSLRSFYAKQTNGVPSRVGFYLSVVALEPGTAFTLVVMSSGQKMQPSHAIQTVDYLIDRFNMISRSFEAQSTIPFSYSTENRIPTGRQPSADSESDATDEGEGGDDAAKSESIEVQGGRRKTKKTNPVDGVDPQELKSFQHLLETLSERRRLGLPRTASILLSGPSEENLEFVQDEDQRLQETQQRLSPPELCPEGNPPESVAVVPERRLTLQGKRQKLRRVIAARLQQKLAPLRHQPTAGGELEKSASTGTLVNFRLANAAPRPVAYSLTTLDPLPRSQRFKAATALSSPRRSPVNKKR